MSKITRLPRAGERVTLKKPIRVTHGGGHLNLTTGTVVDHVLACQGMLLAVKFDGYEQQTCDVHHSRFVLQQK